MPRRERANDIIREHSAVIERASEVHDRLSELVLRGGGVHDVAEAVSEVLGGTVEFTETTAGAARRAGGHAVRDGDDWVAAVSAGGEHLGALVLRGRPGLDPVDLRTLERAALVTSLLLLARRTAGEAEQRVRGELLDDLLDAPDRDRRLLRERAARLRTDSAAPHVVLAAGIDRAGPADGTEPQGRESADRQRLWSAASHLAATRSGLASARDGGTVLLLPLRPGEDAAELARQAARHLGGALREPVTVGASAPVRAPLDHPDQVAGAYQEARRCLDALRLLHRTGEGAAAEDLGFLGLLLADGRDIGGFVERTIGQVVAYDGRRGTDLVRTLDAYFASGMSPARTKDDLHVHVNTVAQRLERVGRLLGPDWQSPARALEIQLALRLHALSSAVSRD